MFLRGLHLLGAEAKASPETFLLEPRPVATLGGFDVTIRPIGTVGLGTRVVIAIADTPLEELYVEAADIAGLDPGGLVTRLENRVRGLEQTREA
ncbi:MAG TPA: hypothetical protein VGK51_16195, partial [Actinomycetota bacterium]